MTENLHSKQDKWGLRENIRMLDFCPYLLNQQLLTNLGSRHTRVGTEHTTAQSDFIPSAIGEPSYSPSSTLYRLTPCYGATAPFFHHEIKG